jgi:hypothetical protein
MDSLIVLTKQQFDTIVVNCNLLLTKLRIINIKDSDHLQIIRLINTINISQDRLFKDGIYADFMKLVTEKEYEKEVSIYYEWIPSRGMGFYFQKLQIELGGTPHFYSTFTVK